MIHVLNVIFQIFEVSWAHSSVQIIMSKVPYILKCPRRVIDIYDMCILCNISCLSSVVDTIRLREMHILSDNFVPFFKIVLFIFKLLPLKHSTRTRLFSTSESYLNYFSRLIIA